jgi:hypothetical protein
MEPFQDLETICLLKTLLKSSAARWIIALAHRKLLIACLIDVSARLQGIVQRFTMLRVPAEWALMPKQL